MEVPKNNQNYKSLEYQEKLPYKSKHFLLELYKCDCEKLNDESFLRCTLNNASKLANATILNLISHKFKPQGVTAIALLAESHLSIHTWPESNYAAIDIFTCGQNMKPDISCKYLIKAFIAQEYFLHIVNRNPPLKIHNQIRTVN